MRATRSIGLLIMTALLVLVPTISPGGIQNKGPFDIDPETEEPNVPFDLSVAGDGCRDPEPTSESSSTSSNRGTDVVLLGFQTTNVHVQVVDTEGNAGPPDTVLESENYDPDGLGDGEWGSPPLIAFPDGLPAGTYLVTAECQHLNGAGSEDADSASSAGSTPMFVLLGVIGPEEPRCTEQDLPDPPSNIGPGCYEAQELVIETAAAEPLEEEPTFTG